MCRLNYLIAGHTVNIFTDPASLEYIYPDTSTWPCATKVSCTGC